MAKAKKKTAKTANKPKRAAKKSASAAKKKRTPAPQLASVDRQGLLKGRAGWQDIVDDVVRAMKSRGVRVSGVSTAKLASLHAKAGKAAQREEELLEKQQRAMRPVQNARLIAVDAAWRALLEVNATVRFLARRDPSLLEDFKPLLDLMTNETTPTEPAPS